MNDSERIQGQVERTGATGAFQGRRDALHRADPGRQPEDEIIELSSEYSVFDASGTQLGAVRQTGQSTLKEDGSALHLTGSVHDP
jgi:hypothetical protein